MKEEGSNGKRRTGTPAPRCCKIPYTGVGSRRDSVVIGVMRHALYRCGAVPAASEAAARTGVAMSPSGTRGHRRFPTVPGAFRL